MSQINTEYSDDDNENDNEYEIIRTEDIIRLENSICEKNDENNETDENDESDENYEDSESIFIKKPSIYGIICATITCPICFPLNFLWLGWSENFYII